MEKDFLCTSDNHMHSESSCELDDKCLRNSPGGCNYMQLITHISNEILSVYDSATIIEKLHENLNLVIDVPIMAIGLISEESKYLNFFGIEQDKTIKLGNLSIEDQNIWAVHCYQSQEEIVHNDPVTENSIYHFSNLLFKYDAQFRKSFVYLPLTSKKRKLGVFTLQSFHEGAFEQHHLVVLRSIANMLTIAFENAISYSKIEQQNKIINEKTEKLENTLSHLEELVVERTHALELANKELDLLSIVALHTNNAIMIMNPEGDILWINQCFQVLYGYKFADFIKARGNNIRSTSFNTEINFILDECIKTKNPQLYKAENISASGENLWTQTSLTPILDDSNNIKYLVTIDTDISKIIEAEKQIIEQTENIKRSIRYASRIQRAKLPPKKVLNEFFPDNFVLYMPRDIVSGDFYWVGTYLNYRIIVAADCTGHGVPGAFVSMLAISLIDEIVKQKSIKNAADFLNILREMLIGRLYSHDSDEELQDGLDLSVCFIDDTSKEINFAGANNPLMLIRKGRLYEYKGDKMPVGIHPSMYKSFTNNVIEYQNGDLFYIFSDGYESQFGGENDKKFMRRRLKQLLISISKLSLSEQRNILKNEIIRWMGLSNNQTDDILVVGFSC